MESELAKKQRPDIAKVDRIIQSAPIGWREDPAIKDFIAYLRDAYAEGLKQADIARDLGFQDASGLSRRMKAVGLRIRRVLEEVA